MSDGFYRAFEDKHRGTRELIKGCLRVYLPLIRPLAVLYPYAQAIDLGCGRGEWLELLAESGFDARGIDLDDEMLAECRTRGLNVQTLDAISALKALPDSSHALVSGFHLAEHIPFEMLQELVQEAHRILLPGGLLILETPNPENIVVGTANFYLDPTHTRPIPPLLLSFLPEYYGFSRVKVLRLQEPVDLADTRKLTIHDVLGGVSPDYAVVAQKAAPEDILHSISQAFESEHGVTLADVSGKYEAQQASSLHDLDRKIADVDRDLEQRLVRELDELDQKLGLALRDVDRDLEQRLIRKLVELDHKLNLTIRDVDRNLDRRLTEQGRMLTEQGRMLTEQNHRLTEQSQLLQEQRDRLSEADQRSRVMETQLAEFRRSAAWRLTAPIRWAGHQAKLVRERGVASRFKALIRKLGRPAVNAGDKLLSAHPRFRGHCVSLAKRVGLYDKLKAAGRPTAPAIDPQRGTAVSPDELDQAVARSAPAVRQVYNDLNEAIDRKDRR